MAENSVHGLLWDLATAIENLLEGWDNNLDGVDLNELEANKYYPFDKSLDEIYTDVINWAEEVEEEIGSNTFDAKGKVDTSHIHLFDSLKESKKLTEDEEKIIVHELPDGAYGQDYWNWFIDDEGLYGKDGKNGLIILYDDGSILKNYTQFSNEELEDAIYEDGTSGLSELIGKEYAEFDIGYYPVGEFSDEWLSELSDVAKGYFTVYEVQNNEDGKYETIIGDTVLTTFSKRGSDEEQIAEILGVSPEQIVIKKPRRTYVYDSYQPTKGRKLNETWAGEDVISNLVDRAKSMIDDGDDLDDAVQRALDDGLIYTKDIRTLAEHYDVLPSDGELVSMFYEELYGDVYNEASDYYDEVHEDDDEDFEESYRRVKSLVEKRGEKFVYDEDDLVVEVQKLKDVYKKKGADALAGTPFKTIRLKYPNFTKWFEKYHAGMEGNDDGELDENSTPIAEYWEVMDDVDFDSLFDFIDHKGKQIPIKYYMKHAGSYDSGLDETENMKELIQTGQIQMANGGK